MSRFRLYQLVRVRRLLSQHRNDLSSGRLPVIADVGTIVDAYSQPHEAYTVECVLPMAHQHGCAIFVPTSWSLYDRVARSGVSVPPGDPE